jgi:hypothetical protein
MARLHRRWPLPLWRRIRWQMLLSFFAVVLSAALFISGFLMLLGSRS